MTPMDDPHDNSNGREPRRLNDLSGKRGAAHLHRLKNRGRTGTLLLQHLDLGRVAQRKKQAIIRRSSKGGLANDVGCQRYCFDEAPLIAEASRG
jgi:hypothetical protein